MSPELDAGNTGPLLALIVGNDDEVTGAIQSTCQQQGFDATLINEGQAVIGFLVSTTPDVVIVDMDDAKLWGKEVIYLLQTVPTFRKTQLVLITSDTRISERYQAQASAILGKPLSQSQVWSAIAGLVS